MYQADIVELVHQNLAETIREITRRSRGVVHEEGGLLLYAGAPLDPALWNGALRVHPGLPAEEVVNRARRFFEERGRGFTLHAMGPLDPDLDATMKSIGRKADSDSPQMVLEAPIQPPPILPGVTMQEVNTDEQREDFLTAVSSGFRELGVRADTWWAAYPDVRSLSAPHIVAIVAYLERNPVAGAMVYMSHGVAEVIHVGVSPAHRRRGLGELVTCAVISAGFDRGARMASLQATPMGESVYRRIGFREIARYRWYIFPAPEEAQTP
ncbi:hypothetical protein Thermus77311_23930 [Thermus antranikianii]